MLGAGMILASAALANVAQMGGGDGAGESPGPEVEGVLADKGGLLANCLLLRSLALCLLR